MNDSDDRHGDTGRYFMFKAIFQQYGRSKPGKLNRYRRLRIESLERRECLTWTVTSLAGNWLAFVGTAGDDTIDYMDIPAGKTTIYYIDETDTPIDTGVVVNAITPPPKIDSAPFLL